jgi:hypothetical protein
VIDLLDLVRRHSLLEVGLQGVKLVLRYGMEVGGGACQVVDHRKAYQLPIAYGAQRLERGAGASV